MQCVNLQQRFGDRYRIAFDPVYDTANRPKESRDPWYMVVRCRYGEIYPYDRTRLVVEVEGHPKLKTRLARLPAARFTRTAILVSAPSSSR